MAGRKQSLEYALQSKSEIPQLPCVASLVFDQTRADMNTSVYRYKLFQAVGNGTDGVQHCGAVGATCEFHDMIDDCKGLASRGYGFHHYIISALTNFQSHLNFVNGEFQTKAIADGFRIDSMVSDFSTPKEYQVASGIAAYVSASLFIAGGAAGSTTLAASKVRNV